MVNSLSFLNPTTITGALLLAVIFLGLSIGLSMIVRRIAHRIEKHLSDITAVRYSSLLVEVLIFIVGFILYAHLIPELRALGSALLAGISVTSIIVGLAAQQTLSNLIAGFSLILYRPVKIGDLIQLNTPRGLITARVEGINLGFTSLVNDEKLEIIVPNTIMMTSTLIRLENK